MSSYSLTSDVTARHISHRSAELGLRGRGAQRRSLWEELLFLDPLLRYYC